ncbi:hypothetical protein BVI434_410074 [Burkholderia vietnamiensis]|nr:hypothetical protein BVI434_410074 [Burkholderia vietnamiensis]
MIPMRDFPYGNRRSYGFKRVGAVSEAWAVALHSRMIECTAFCASLCVSFECSAKLSTCF